MKMRTAYPALLIAAGVLLGCGKANEVITQASNSVAVPGNWLMTESQHGGAIDRALEKDSMVLTFKDGKAAFSPVDSLKGRAVYAALNKCTSGPRPYRTEKDQLVFDATADCPEKRVTVTQADLNTLKFPDPVDNDIVRTFVRVDDARYQDLVKASDRHLE